MRSSSSVRSRATGRSSFIRGKERRRSSLLTEDWPLLRGSREISDSIVSTADFQTTMGIRRIIESSGNVDDLLAFFAERLLPVEEIEANRLAEEVIANPPDIGYLTISNALQWRLQYRRVITDAGEVDGILRVR